jgi:hypothetical protein
MPWDTCPGAGGQLAETFAGLPLSEVTARREKKQNCTHLHDLAVFAASHAGDAAGFEYDIAATDPVGGVRILEIRRDGETVHRWTEREGVIVDPAEVAGQGLMTMRDWIGSLSGIEQEAARGLQWASLVVHGRTIPYNQQSAATDLPPNCYTLQPERAVHANRVGDRLDFSKRGPVPLAGFRATMLGRLENPAQIGDVPAVSPRFREIKKWK